MIGSALLLTSELLSNSTLTKLNISYTLNDSKDFFNKKIQNTSNNICLDQSNQPQTK